MASETPAERVAAEVPRQKPRRLISLQYNYSDSDEEETREERKARIVSEDHLVHNGPSRSNREFSKCVMCAILR